MRDALLPYYVWIKATHIIFVVAWMAGLMVYPRYKIHQLTGTPGGELSERMQHAAQLLKRMILTPSMTLVWLIGLTMLWLNPALLSAGWLHTKLALVLALTGLHTYFVIIGRRIDQGSVPIQARQLRMLNELPFILMIGIVLLAVAKPF